LVCDPSPDTRLKGGADVAVFSEEPQPSVKANFVVDGPGEYEVKGALIKGIPAQRHSDESGQATTIYQINVDGINVAYLGNITPELSNNQIEELGQVDALVIPVGGHGLTLDAQAASKLVSQLEPKYVVPVHYDDGRTKYEVPQDKLDVFLSEIGATPEPQSKLRLLPSEMPLETTVVKLQIPD
jgi:L-ascorbate metabolism protein UlaG (beta-lactamase superfamily)